jgi:hypothetical protein
MNEGRSPGPNRTRARAADGRIVLQHSEQKANKNNRDTSPLVINSFCRFFRFFYRIRGEYKAKGWRGQPLPGSAERMVDIPTLPTSREGSNTRTRKSSEEPAPPVSLVAAMYSSDSAPRRFFGSAGFFSFAHN